MAQSTFQGVGEKSQDGEKKGGVSYLWGLRVRTNPKDEPNCRPKIKIEISEPSGKAQADLHESGVKIAQHKAAHDA
jgi:hypothetical protein